MSMLPWCCHYHVDVAHGVVITMSMLPWYCHCHVDVAMFCHYDGVIILPLYCHIVAMVLSGCCCGVVCC